MKKEYIKPDILIFTVDLSSLMETIHLSGERDDFDANDNMFDVEDDEEQFGDIWSD